MKRFLIMLLSGIVSLAATAQSITITFNGNTNTTNNNNNGNNRVRNYQVILDGTSYFSNADNANTNTNPNTTVNANDIILSNQQMGSHTIEVYRQRNNNENNNGTNTDPSGNSIYENTFQLRQGYDMNIAINGYGQVTFAEKRVRTQGRRGDNQVATPMEDVTFNQLLHTVRSKRFQSAKLAVERDAFLNTANYFTTSQARQLLLLISVESNRLALAKMAYPKVTDPATFTQLYNVFTSTYSRNEMNVFIQNNPNNNNSNNNGNWGNNNNNNNNNNNTYKTPMADNQFSQLLQSINSQYNQAGKFNAISGAINNGTNYFSTSQVRQLLTLINAETDKLALAKQSYLRVSDPANFNSLYDLFYNQSSRNDLNNYVVQNGGTATNTKNNNTRTPMTEGTFSKVLQKVSNHFLPWDKVRDARDAFNNTSYFFTTSQIRQLLAVNASEDDRLDLAKLAWSRVTDPSYFTQLLDMFTNQANRDDLSAYIQAHPF